MESDLSIEDRVDYLTKEMKKYDKSYNGEVKDAIFDKYDKEILDRINSSLSKIGTYSKKEIRKVFNNMVKDSVKQFIDLLLNGESVENAMNKSGVGEMKMADILRAIASSEYIEEISKVIAGVKEANAMQDIIDSAKEAIHTVKDLDASLVELTKVTDTPTQELEDLYEGVKSSEPSDK